MAEINAFVSGFVQGTGFRHFVMQRAKGIGLKGFVRNCPDGTVEVVAQGPREKLELLLEELKKGPSFGRVEKIRVEWQKETKGFDGFGVEF